MTTRDDASHPEAAPFPGAAPSAEEVTVTACPDGPLLVRGPAEILGPDGEPVPRTRATVALCRCGGTAIAPWCDGTHKVNGYRTDG
ncbi:hypothetical protein GCM10027063_17080 [Promicromonospora xylanilytica]